LRLDTLHGYTTQTPNRAKLRRFTKYNIKRIETGVNIKNNMERNHYKIQNESQKWYIVRINCAKPLFPLQTSLAAAIG
jgi:hypothetical protein